jgi:D-alanine-D-alanine ligase
VCKALRSKGHAAILMDVFVGHEGLDIGNIFDKEFSIEKELEYIKETAGDLEALKKERKEFFGPNVLELCKAADCVFMGLHGACGEDGKVQATFDLLGIKYTGADYLESAMAMDKAVSRKIFYSDNVPMAKGYKIDKKDNIIFPTDKDLKYPVVVKPNCGGSSIGVYFANNDEEYKAALEKAFAYEDTLIVEERIIGREFSVGVIGYKPYPVIEIITGEGEAYDYANKYNGTTLEVCPANVEESIGVKMQEAAVKAAK